MTLSEAYDVAAASAVDYPCQLCDRPRACDICPITPDAPECLHHDPSPCAAPCWQAREQGLVQCEGRR
jgi:hypothetical protein